MTGTIHRLTLMARKIVYEWRITLIRRAEVRVGLPVFGKAQREKGSFIRVNLWLALAVVRNGLFESRFQRLA
jgi:hypothetical protein